MVISGLIINTGAIFSCRRIKNDNNFYLVFESYRSETRYLCRPGPVPSAMAAGSGMLPRYRSPGSAVAPPVSVCSQAPGVQHPVGHRP
ncbi:MAG: hypothetical protein KZQ71_07430 [Candidatus Thiodiazotropha sp. (ex Lucinoma aequizonata)]|nr:hypothetical protein [Candidatus Thiodiazotropha sp. (ex Lucinoma aequizonata)]